MENKGKIRISIQGKRKTEEIEREFFYINSLEYHDQHACMSL